MNIQNHIYKYTGIYAHYVYIQCIYTYGSDVSIGHSGNYQNYMTHIYDTEKSADMWGTFILNSFHDPSKRQLTAWEYQVFFDSQRKGTPLKSNSYGSLKK